MSRRSDRQRQALDQRLGHVRVAMESVYHRHNVSAVLRTCEGMGIHHVHLVEGHFKPSRGPTRGAERWLALHHHPSAEHAIAELRAAGFAIWVADFAEPPVPPEAVPLDRPVCLWFGAELVGVSPEARKAADGVVTVPMWGLAQSLNVSVACGMTVRAVAERARLRGPQAMLSEAEKAATFAAWTARDADYRVAPDAEFTEAP